MDPTDSTPQWKHALNRLQAMGQQMFRFSVPLYIWNITNPYPTPKFAASALLADSGERQFYVTCKHVWDKYLWLKTRYPPEHIGLCAQVGARPRSFLHLSEISLVDQSSDLDLCILRGSLNYSNDFIEALASGGRLHYRPPFRSFPVPKEGEEILLLGSPGRSRSLIHDPKGYTMVQGHTTLSLSATSISRGRLLRANTAGRKGTRSADAPSHDFLGGMSGSPAWLQRDGKLYVTGIFHEGATAHDTILVTLLEDFLRTDGTLDHLAIPPCYSRYHGEGYGESIPDDRFE